MGFQHKGRTVLAVAYDLDGGRRIIAELTAEGECGIAFTWNADRTEISHVTIRHSDPAKRLVQLRPSDVAIVNDHPATVAAVTVVRASDLQCHPAYEVEIDGTRRWAWLCEDCLENHLDAPHEGPHDRPCSGAYVLQFIGKSTVTRREAFLAERKRIGPFFPNPRLSAGGQVSGGGR